MSEQEASNSVTFRHAFRNVLSFSVLLLIAIIAFLIRLFSVIKYESVIHQFHPYFNYRLTQLANAEEYIDGQCTRSLGEILMRPFIFKQLDTNVSLKESDAWPTEPQDAYGWRSLQQRSHASTRTNILGLNVGWDGSTTFTVPWAHGMMERREGESTICLLQESLNIYRQV